MKLRFLLTTAATVFLAAAPAYAGFTLITPDNPVAPSAPTAAPVTSIQTAPAGNFQSQPQFQPQGTASANPNVSTHIGPATVELSAIPAPGVMPPQTSIVAMPMTTPAVEVTAVKGFGKDIPLVIAAQQIAPADYQIAFGQGVDPSMPVSWRGGQPWHTVLSDALDKRGLKMTEQGSLIFISQSKADLGTNKASLLMQPKDSIGNAVPNASTMMSRTTAPVDLVPTSMQIPAQTMEAQPASRPAMTPQSNLVATPMVRTAAPTAVAVTALPDINQPIPASAMAVVPLTGTAIATPVHVPEQTTWHASAGQTLKQTLEAWSHNANITLRWDSEYDYPVQASVTMDGDYESAVRSLLRGFRNAQPQPIARLYHPSHGMVGVLLVSDRGNDMSTSQ